MSLTITAVAAMSTLAKNTYDLVRSLHQSTTDLEHKQQLLDISDKLMELRGMAFDLAEENCTLKRTVEEIQRKADDLENYSLHELAPGVLVYSYQPAQESFTLAAGIHKPDHYLCSACFHEGKKAILKRVKHGSDGVHWACPLCKNDFIDYTRPKEQGAVILVAPSPAPSILDRY